MAAFQRKLPASLAAIEELALDLRWTWSHAADRLWRRIDVDAWNRTHNPWAMHQSVSLARLNELAADRSFLKDLEAVTAAHRAYLEGPRWFDSAYGAEAVKGIAYFSMEWGLSDALPLYAGGLGILAGDMLKTGSDLGVPIVGVGLLFGQGYFRQSIDAAGRQQEVYPYNDPATMPVTPVYEGGDWLRIPLALPGRILNVRVWQASVGRTMLYLLDTNDPFNSPSDRGITARLYEGQLEIRLLQEIVLGVSGWRLIERLRPELELCHINEGHAALAVIERARSLARKQRQDFPAAWHAARAGTVFTTHTAVSSGFDSFPLDLMGRYLRVLFDDGPPLAELLALGQPEQGNGEESFNMAFLAARGANATLAVSRLHEGVSRRIFAPLFPRRPLCEIPIGHVTNAVHVPSWDSAAADSIWTAACGKDRWRGMPDDLGKSIDALSDEEIWAMRGHSRQELVEMVRTRLGVQLRSRGLDADRAATASSVFDPNILTLGFARRFTGYKRPNLLLHDAARFGRFLRDERRPAQIVVAGKAHPEDIEGKKMIQEWVAFAARPEFRHRVVFLEDYDIALAQEFVKGVDLWINTPHRPWEACGTSGMKVLANGGLNLSELDGWWSEAYRPELGWAIGDGTDSAGEGVDEADAEALYNALEGSVAQEFYARDASGMPRAWLKRIRRSMALLAPRFCGTRMLHDYIRSAYLPAARAWRERIARSGAGAKEIAEWETRVRRAWPKLHLGTPIVQRTGNCLAFTVAVYLDEMDPAHVEVELYANPKQEDRPEIISLHRGEAIAGTSNGHLYTGRFISDRPVEDFTVRIIPAHPLVYDISELPLILWQN